jgi:hypothetical protein
MARLENQGVELLPFKRFFSLVFKYIDPQTVNRGVTVLCTVYKEKYILSSKYESHLDGRDTA